jgi:putative ABC transport system permease protein
MPTNNFKLAFRHLLKTKVFTLINIIGLSIGIAAFLLIMQYISFELSFDRFHTNKDQIYRVGLKRFANGELVEISAKTFPGVRVLLKENFPEIQHVTGFYKTPANTGFLFRFNGKIYNEEGGHLNPDSSFFNVFPSLLRRGNASTALKHPNSLILSESLAKKLFGDKDPIGQTLDRVDDHTDGSNFTVTGVLKDIPANSHFHASIIEHIRDTWPESEEELWGESRLSTYVTFSENAKADLVEKKLNTLLSKLQKENKQIENTEITLEPITDIHLMSNCKDELEANGNYGLLCLLGGIGLIILTIAWINYINLETSRFLTRIREIGIRRVIGSRKFNLALQFLTEYFCLTTAAVLLAILMIGYLAPVYADLTGFSSPALQLDQQPIVWIIAFVVFVFGSISAGIYPAIFLLRLSPVSALKGKIDGFQSGLRIRQALLVFQFTASIVLIAFVVTMNRQLDFMQSINKGLELETVIAVRNPTAYADQDLTAKHGEFANFENTLLQYPGFGSLASSSAIPGSEIGFSYINLIKRNMGDPYNPTMYKTLFVSQDFIKTYNIELLAGEAFATPENFRGEAPWETKNWSTIILNESAIHQLGFKSAADAVNKEVYFQAFNDFLKCRIIGVIRDYHHEAVKTEVYPTILFHNYNTFQQVYYSIRLRAGTKQKEALAQIEQTWKTIFPDRPFEYFFLDEYYDRQFKAEVHFEKIFILFAGISIVVACLGILGITLFEMNARLKEISIRKVLGASVAGLVIMLSRTNIRLILISGAISFPIIFFLTNYWLSRYPERIEFSPILTFAPLAITLVVVMFVSGIQTIKAAASNPVDHLKDE